MELRDISEVAALLALVEESKVLDTPRRVFLSVSDFTNVGNLLTGQRRYFAVGDRGGSGVLEMLPGGTVFCEVPRWTPGWVAIGSR